MDHFYTDIKGWFDYQEIYNLMVSEAINTAHFVEVGVYHGRSAAFMAVEIANSGKKISFDCIDSWDGRNEGGHGYNSNHMVDFIIRMKLADGYFTPISGVTPEIAKSYANESLDFVWIDALHEYEYVKADIIAWLPKIKKGGYLGGHDYVEGHANGVEKAVKEMLPTYKIYNGELVGSWLHHKI